MSTNIVYFNLRLRVAGMYASLTKSNKKKRKLQSKRNQWVHHKLASANVIIASRVYQFLLNQILETTIAPLIYLYYLEIKGDPKHNFVGSTWNLRSLWQSQRMAYRKTSPWDYSRVITNWHNCINYIKWNQEIINYISYH